MGWIVYKGPNVTLRKGPCNPSVKVDQQTPFTLCHTLPNASTISVFRFCVWGEASLHGGVAYVSAAVGGWWAPLGPPLKGLTGETCTQGTVTSPVKNIAGEVNVAFPTKG